MKKIAILSTALLLSGSMMALNYSIELNNFIYKFGIVYLKPIKEIILNTFTFNKLK